MSPVVDPGHRRARLGGAPPDGRDGGPSGRRRVVGPARRARGARRPGDRPVRRGVERPALAARRTPRLPARRTARGRRRLARGHPDLGDGGVARRHQDRGDRELGRPQCGLGRRESSATPTASPSGWALRSRSERWKAPASALAWLDDTTVGVLSHDGAASFVVEQLIGGPAGDDGGTRGITSIAGGSAISPVRLRGEDGALYVRRGTNWQQSAAGILVLATQQGSPRADGSSSPGRRAAASVLIRRGASAAPRPCAGTVVSWTAVTGSSRRSGRRSGTRSRWCSRSGARGCDEPDIALCEDCAAALMPAPQRRISRGDAAPTISPCGADSASTVSRAGYSVRSRRRVAPVSPARWPRRWRAAFEAAGDPAAVLVPVPTSRAAFRRRGYRVRRTRRGAGGPSRGAAAACRRVARRTSGARPRRPAGQCRRKPSVAGCRGPRVVVVDDVVTTGATLDRGRPSAARRRAPRWSAPHHRRDTAPERHDASKLTGDRRQAPRIAWG